MSDYDPIKATKEELSGLTDVMHTMRRREMAAEQAMSMAENELNSIRKLRGYCEIEMGKLRTRLTQLEAEQDAKSNS